MSDPVPVSAIPGISAAIATALEAHGIFSSADLLGSNRAVLAAAVPAATLAALRRWQTFAQLLEIEAITPALVDTLVTSGIDGLDEFGSRSLAQLRQATRNTPAAPTDEELFVFMKDAQRLRFTGVVYGTVIARGAPVDNATVRIGGFSTRTDARGRFRIARLPLGTQLSATIEHAEMGAKIFRSVRASPSSAIIARTFALPGHATRAIALSALRGDIVPSVGSAPMTTAAQDGLPDPRDVLRVVDFYANGDARIVSRFVDFSDGQFKMRTYRIPVAQLPTGVAPHDNLVTRDGKLVKRSVSARSLSRRSRVAAIRNRRSKHDRTPAGLERLGEEILNALSDKRR